MDVMVAGVAAMVVVVGATAVEVDVKEETGVRAVMAIAMPPPKAAIAPAGRKLVMAIVKRATTRTLRKVVRTDYRVTNRVARAKKDVSPARHANRVNPVSRENNASRADRVRNVLSVASVRRVMLNVPRLWSLRPSVPCCQRRFLPVTTKQPMQRS